MRSGGTIGMFCVSKGVLCVHGECAEGFGGEGCAASEAGEAEVVAHRLFVGVVEGGRGSDVSDGGAEGVYAESEGGWIGGRSDGGPRLRGVGLWV